MPTAIGAAMNKLPWLTLALLSLLAAPRSAFAAEVALFPVEAPNLAPRDAIAIGEALAQSYELASSARVLGPSRTAEALAGGATYEDAARTLSVREFVRTSAIAAGGQIAIFATRQRADGTVIFQTRMVAPTTEQLLTVCERIASDLYARRHREYVHTSQHARIPGTRARLYGVKSGVHLPFARNASYRPNIGVSFDLRLELEQFFLEFGAGLVLPTRSSDFDDETTIDGVSTKRRNDHGSTAGVQAEFGASRFLTQSDVGLYLGGGIIPRIHFRNDIASMYVYGQLGISAPRSSSVRISGDLRLAQAVIPQHLNNDRTVLPSELTLQAGVGW